LGEALGVFLRAEKSETNRLKHDLT
jgi:hypothetical protein